MHRLFLIILISIVCKTASFYCSSRKSIEVLGLQRVKSLKNKVKTALDNDISSTSPNLLFERVESAKYGIGSLIGGTIASLPVAILHGFIVEHFNGHWEFQQDMLAPILLLFGLVYRYSTRGTKNSQIKLGVATAFILTRTLSEVQVPDVCSSIPLDCGPPLHYLSIEMIQSILWYGSESALAFLGASYFLDFLIKKKLLSTNVIA